MTEENILKVLDEAWLNRRSEMRNSFHIAKNYLSLCHENKLDECEAECHKILGYCYWRFSEFSLSMEHSLLALDFYRATGNLRGESDTLNSLGAVFMFQKDHVKRLKCNLECLEIRRQLGNPDDISGSMNNIGETYLEMGDLESAGKWFVDCIEYPGSTNDSKAWALHNLGRVHLIENRFEDSLIFLSESLKLSNELQYDVLSTVTLLRLSEACALSLNFNQAESYALEALKLAEKCGAKEEQKEAFLLLSLYLEKEGRYQEALEFHKTYHSIYCEIHDETNLQRIKDMEFTYELENARKQAEIERLRGVELREAYEQIEKQKELLEQRNKEIVDSIRYAQRIQQAVLKEEQHVSLHLPEHFILYRPKDIVSGDFYWAQEKNGVLYVAAADCTGHGVPGGFLTMLGIAFLNEIISKNEIQTPAQILNELRNKFIKELMLHDAANDGMDIALISMKYDAESEMKELMWAGAYNPLWIIRNRKELDIYPGTSSHRTDLEFMELHPDKQPIGKSDELKEFTDHKVFLEKGDMIYLFSDGYQDQFGGDQGKKLKRAGFKQVLLSLAEQPMDNQLKGLDLFFEAWKGDLDQVDDVCVIGIKI